MNKKIIILWAILLIGIHLAAAMSVGQLADSYNYDYSDGSMKIVQFTDYMVDANSDAINDTLVFNLTTNVTASTSYFFIVKLFENDHLVQNYTNATVSGANPTAKVSFDTRQLQLNQYNYTVDVRDQNYALVYSKYRTQTNQYANFAVGTKIAAISDQKISNALRINVSFNVTQNSTSNITAFLTYNTNKTIQSTVQANLTIPYSTVSIDFDNETIKSTHYNGSFAISAVQIDNKLLSSNLSTANYSFTDFAQTSYIKSINSSIIDLDSNNLSDTLQFNITIKSMAAGNYTIQTSLYDPNNNLITALNNSQYLNTGDQVMSLNVSGSTIYKTYASGQFILPVIVLQQNNAAIDAIYGPYYTLDYSYGDFERPPLPDLTVSVTSNFSNGTVITTLNVSNQGLIPAFNFVTDIFDNGTYQNETITTMLQPNQSLLLNYTIQNTTDANFYTAIVDFGNAVDESNETNNFASNYRLPDNSTNSTGGGNDTNYTRSFVVQNLSSIDSDSLVKTLQFVIYNNGSAPINASWAAYTGEGNVYSVMNTSLAAGEKSVVLMQYSYSSRGLFTVIVNVSDGNSTSTQSMILDVKTLRIVNATQHGNNMKIIAFTVRSSINDVVGWSINTGETTINSTMPTNISAGENVSYVIQYAYSGLGVYLANISVNSSADYASKLITIPVAELSVSNFVKLSSGATKGIFAFDVQDTYNSSKVMLWSLDTNDTGVVLSTQNVTLAPDERVYVVIENNFTTAGNKLLTAQASTNLSNVTALLNATI